MAAAQNYHQAKVLYDQEEMRLRRRKLNFFRFIGELYKLQMLTARIMQSIIKKLLQIRDEFSLQCLCRLLISVGQILDQETTQRLSKEWERIANNGLNDLSVYFSKMVEITQDTKVSSRVRSHLQFVIQLRLADWKKTMETTEEDIGWLEVSEQLSDFELDEDDGDFLLSSAAGEVLTADDTEEQ